MCDKEEDKMIEFQNRLQVWLEGAQKIVDDYYRDNFPNLFFGEDYVELKATAGRRYVKIETHCPRITSGRITSGNRHMVFAFIDMTNGDVLKAATWRKPAKTARGNIFNTDDGLTCVNPFGIQYLK